MRPQQAAFDWTPPAAKVAKLGPPSPSLSGAGWEERARTRGYSEAQAKALNDADAGSVLTTETSGRWRWGARRGGYLTATVRALAARGLIEPTAPVRTTINPMTGDREISPGQVHAFRLTRAMLEAGDVLALALHLVVIETQGRPVLAIAAVAEKLRRRLDEVARGATWAEAKRIVG